MNELPYILDGPRIKTIREGCGLSAAEVVVRMGLKASSGSMITAIESGRQRPTEKTARRIAEALGVFLSDITRHGPALAPWVARGSSSDGSRAGLLAGSAARPLSERLSEKFKVNEAGCWIWQCRINQSGYGEIKVPGGRRVKAHRAMYEQHVGPIPDGLDLDHLCRVRACVNPAHLEPVTRQDNLRRAHIALNWGDSRTHCMRGHELTPENTRAQLRSNNRWVRACKTCTRNWHAKNRARKLAA